MPSRLKFFRKYKGAVFFVACFIYYNLIGWFTAMNRSELIIMLTILAVGVCVIIIIILIG